jgi:hypothetical protein
VPLKPFSKEKKIFFFQPHALEKKIKDAKTKVLHMCALLKMSPF